MSELEFVPADVLDGPRIGDALYFHAGDPDVQARRHVKRLAAARDFRREVDALPDDRLEDIP